MNVIWKIIDVHQIPAKYTENNEIDFYCSNGIRLYLLRFRYRKTEFHEIIDDSKEFGYPPYLIAEFPIQKIDNQVIKNVLNKFKL